MTRAAVLLLSASVSLAAPGVKEKEPVLYFPVKEGTKFVIESNTGGRTSELAETVTKVTSAGGKYTVTVTQDRAEWATPKVYEVSPQGLTRVDPSRKDAEPPPPLLKLPAKAGDTWSTTFGENKATFTTGKEEEVQVPAGKFMAIPVTTVFVAGKRMHTSTVWYAPGVGIVKSTSDGSTWVLKSFTPGK